MVRRLVQIMGVDIHPVSQNWQAMSSKSYNSPPIEVYSPWSVGQSSSGAHFKFTDQWSKHIGPPHDTLSDKLDGEMHRHGWYKPGHSLEKTDEIPCRGRTDRVKRRIEVSNRKCFEGLVSFLGAYGPLRVRPER